MPTVGTSADMLEAAIPKLRAALESAMKPSVAKVVKAAKPIAPHATPVAVTATAKAPVRKLAPAPEPAAPAPKKAKAYNPFDDEEEVVKAPVSAPVAESKKGAKKGPRKEGYVESGHHDFDKPMPGIPEEAVRDVLLKSEVVAKTKMIRKFITIPPKNATLHTLQKFAADYGMGLYTKEGKTKSELRTLIEKRLENVEFLAHIYYTNHYIYKKLREKK